MKKRMFVLLMIVVMITACACGGSTGTTENTSTNQKNEATTQEGASEEKTTEEKSMNKPINFTVKEGNLKYIGYEKSEIDLMDDDDDKALIFVFEYTNYQDEPSQAQNTFYTQFYQNRIEITEYPGYIGETEQTELVSNYFKETLKNGTIRYGLIVRPKNDSPITISVRYTGEDSKDERQMMEVDIRSEEKEKGNVIEDNKSSSSIKETDYMSIEGLYVDESYKSKETDEENNTFLYVFYSAFTNKENLKIDCKSMKLTVNDTNTYDARRDNDQIRYLRTYYNEGYLKTINVGDSGKFVETFSVPKAELEAGRTITLEKSQIPETDKIILSTDDIVFCKNPKKIAKKADPEGYKKEKKAMKDADEDRVDAVRNELNDYEYYQETTTPEMTYKFVFSSPNNYEQKSSAPNIGTISTVYGTYRVKNGYIILDNDDGKSHVRVPYTQEDGKYKFDFFSALDMGKSVFLIDYK